MSTITICTSASFYKQAIAVKKELEELGFTVIVPKTALVMEEKNDFDVEHYKTWFADASDYHKKGELMRAHFDKVAEGDAVLVLNYEKHGQQNYIGGNVLMEMSLGFYLHKPIFILNDYPENSPFEEEIKGFEPYVLQGNLRRMSDLLSA